MGSRSATGLTATTGGFQLEDWVAGDAVQVTALCSVLEQVLEHLADGPHAKQFALAGEGSHVLDEGWFLLEAIGVVWVADDDHFGSLQLTKKICKLNPVQLLTRFHGLHKNHFLPYFLF